DFYLGSREPGDGTQVWMEGSIDEVRVWNVVRSQAEIRDFRFAEMTAHQRPDSLVAYYSMNGYGQALVDGAGTADGYLGTTSEGDPADPARSFGSAPFSEAPVATNLTQTISFNEDDVLV